MILSKKSTAYITIVFIFTFITILLYKLQTDDLKTSIYLRLINDDEDDFNNEFLNNTRNNSKLFNLKFNYVLNSNVCENDTNILATFIVTSYFGNVETRSAMRRTLSEEKLRKLNIRRIFLLGLAPNDKYTNQNSILDESNRFKDIVQGNFMEAYRNLTYKHVMGLKWISEYCPNTKYVIKMDDDIVVNMHKFINLLKTTKLPQKNLLAGYILQGMLPIKEKANKWYVTEEEYAHKTYPKFVSGWLYITNPSTCRKIYILSQRSKYFWIDDVFVTGILASKLRIKHYDISKYFVVHPEFLECCMKDVQKKLDCDIIIGPNGGNNNLFFQFNEKMDVCKFSECAVRNRSISETCVAERKINLGRGNSIITNFKLN